MTRMMIKRYLLSCQCERVDYSWCYRYHCYWSHLPVAMRNRCARYSCLDYCGQTVRNVESVELYPEYTGLTFGA